MFWVRMSPEGRGGSLRTNKCDWYDGKSPKQFARTEEEVDEDVWMVSNLKDILDRVRRVTPDVLAKIADLVGYFESFDKEPRPKTLGG